MMLQSLNPPKSQPHKALDKNLVARKTSWHQSHGVDQPHEEEHQGNDIQGRGPPETVGHGDPQSPDQNLQIKRSSTQKALILTGLK